VTNGYDAPAAVAEAVVELASPPLVGFDVDGVLAPIVAHAADAALLPGVLSRLIQLAEHVPVGVVSGRTVADLARFGFPASLMVAGSHGAERRGLPLAPLSPIEASRLSRLHSLAAAAANEAGKGAWLEHKPTGVVLHIRESDPARGQAAADRLVTLGALVAGAQVKRGHGVVELVARPASKATAIRTMWDESGASSIVYVGDDVTDEDVFRSLGPDDLGIRVGPGATAATRRLADPVAVTQYLAALVERLKR
jgi:trehalose 6-phosphate phosphatase